MSADLSGLQIASDLVRPSSRDTVLGSDEAFDALYPWELRALAPRQFTPVAIARRAANLLVTSPGTRVLDVGSGAGKFCIVGALSTPGTFTGIERHADLVETARSASQSLGLSATFLTGEMSSIDWRAFDAFYFYNPFAEHLVPSAARVALGRERFFRDVQEAKDRLRSAVDGTRVVTFYGLGACLPGAYRLLLREPAGHDSLDLWIKAPRQWAVPEPRGVQEAA